MNQYFNIEEVGERYDRYRPKVHDIVVEWLGSVCPGKHFKKGIDVACGTGDSLRPLVRICDEVVGIDSSDEMLAIALREKLPAIKGTYFELKKHGKFDLISNCMAFHWFEPELAITSYKAASNKGAIWLIYNFSFGGHETSGAFNKWFKNLYLKKYPTPQRNKTILKNPIQDQCLRLIKEDCGWIPLEFNTELLVGYLSTQSNIEHALNVGCPLNEIYKFLLNELSQINLEGNFKYVYRYEIYQYLDSEEKI